MCRSIVSLGALLVIIAATLPLHAADDTRRRDVNGSILNDYPKPTPRIQRNSKSYQRCVSHSHPKCEKSLEKAIEKSKRGGLIVVSLRYQLNREESLIIDKPLTICAGTVDPDIVCENPRKDSQWLLAPAPHVSVNESRLFELNHKGSDACIKINLEPWPVSDTNRVIIRGMKINMQSKAPTPSCIWVKAGQFKLENSIITSCRPPKNNPLACVEPRFKAAAPAIRIEGGDAEIIGTTINNSSSAIFLIHKFKASIILRNNKFSNNDYGIHMVSDYGHLFAAENWLHGNHIDGIRIDGGIAILVRNRITGNGENGVRTASRLHVKRPSKPNDNSSGRHGSFSADAFPVQLLENDIRDNNAHAVKVRRGAWVLANANCLIRNKLGGFSSRSVFETVRNFEWPIERSSENEAGKDLNSCRQLRRYEDHCERVRRACFGPPRILRSER